MASHSIRVDGALTHYLEEGPADGPKLVLVHDGGFGADGMATWASILPRLSRRYHVFVPDQLGFGATQKLYDFGAGARSQKIDHIARWMDCVGIRSAHFIGNSAGGSLILFAAMRSEWPIVKGVSICGAGDAFMQYAAYGPLRDYVPDKEGMRRIVELMVSRRDAVMEQLVEERYKKSLIRGHWEALSAVRLRPPATGSKPNKERSGEENSSFLSSLAAIKLPMLLIGGSDDRLLDPGWEAKLAEHIPGARSLAVPGARHQPHIDSADLVCEAIESFLEA